MKASLRNWLLAGLVACAADGRAQTPAEFAARTPPPSVVPGSPFAPPPTDFPARPPSPYEDRLEPLTPLSQELWMHGGSYLYQPEGDMLGWPGSGTAPFTILRLPEDYEEPKPATLFAPFLGSDMLPEPHLKFPGPDGGYYWDPRFVGFGSYTLLGFDLTTNRGRRQTALGHQLILDLDLQLTGTERFHVQFRPIGERGTGGSYYQFTDPAGYVDNSTFVPDRYWFDGELHSMLGGHLDPYFTDFHFVVGKFPWQLHNNLLINDEILGVTVNKNTIYVGDLSNLNVIGFYAFDDVDAYPTSDARLGGLHVIAEYRLAYLEMTVAHVDHAVSSRRDRLYGGLSATKFYGPLTVTGRALGEWGDEAGNGAGGLFVLESSLNREFASDPLGFEYALFYMNLFHVTEGWNSIAAGNFNRLRTAFETNPLVRIAARARNPRNTGLALGVQLFRHNEDASLTPEFAIETPEDARVFGVGLRYQHKTGARSYFEALGVWNFSDDDRFDRRGIFLSETIVF